MKTLKQLIKQNNFSWVNQDITEEHFPEQEIRKGTYKLLRFDKLFSSEEALNCKPANIYELLDWLKEHKQELGEWEYCVAFGSEWLDSYGFHRVPVVRRYNAGDFRFNLSDFEGDWIEITMVLCLCDSQPSEPKENKKEEKKYIPEEDIVSCKDCKCLVRRVDAHKVEVYSAPDNIDIYLPSMHYTFDEKFPKDEEFFCEKDKKEYSLEFRSFVGSRYFSGEVKEIAKGQKQNKE